MPEKTYTEDELQLAEAMIDRLLEVGPPTEPDRIWLLWLWSKSLTENAETVMKGMAQQARTTVEKVPQVHGGHNGLR